MILSSADIKRADMEMSVRLFYARQAAQRFFASQEAEAKRLGYPPMAAFAKEMSRGAVSLAPTPEDPELERIGAWYWNLTQANRAAMLCQFSRMDGSSPAKRARTILGWSRDRLNSRVRELLRDLGGAIG